MQVTASQYEATARFHERLAALALQHAKPTPKGRAKARAVADLHLADARKLREAAKA